MSVISGPRLKKELITLFSFSGRINRKKYWLYTIISIFILVLVRSFLPPVAGIFYEYYTSYFSLLIFLTAIWIYLAAHIRRLRDCNLPLTYALALLIPVIGSVSLFALLSFYPSKAPLSEDEEKSIRSSDPYNIKNVFSFKGHISRNERAVLILSSFAFVGLFYGIAEDIGQHYNPLIFWIIFAAGCFIGLWVFTAALFKKLDNNT